MSLGTTIPLSMGGQPARRSSHASAAQRPIALKRRGDILVEPMSFRGERRWHLKDPLTLRYWQFGEEELFLWQQLDGTVSLNEWQTRFHRRFAPQRVELAQLQGLLGMLHQEGLVFAEDATGQAETLLRRDSARRWRDWLGRCANPLAIRFRGVDPDRLLARIVPLVAWMFQPLWLATCVLLIVSAALLLVVEWPSFIARLPAANAFLSADNLIWLAVALAGAKIAHELGHAVTCKYHGGECHEMGVLLLVFTPCLYCNVSDMWLVADKWRRISVSAAGMCVELWLAAAATWLWWFTVPGPLNSLCLNLMLVCSVSTVLFNGNPLLRYDGYFILSDWLEWPNLGTDAGARLRALGKQLIFGPDVESSEPAGDKRGGIGLPVYAVASLVYRVIVVTCILWFLHRMLAGHRLAIVGYALIGLVLAGMSIPLISATWSGFSAPRRRRPSAGRMAWLALIAVALIGGLLRIPVPYSIVAPATLRPEAAAVYVSVPGRLVDGVRPGAPVRRGDRLAELSNDNLDFEITRLSGELAVLRQHAEILRRQQVGDLREGMASSSGQRTMVEQAMRDVDRQLMQLREERNRLVIRAPADGVVIAPPGQHRPARDEELDAWAGTPADPRNLGCYLESGVLLGYVGNPSRAEALVLVDQANVACLAVGQEVTVQLDALPGEFLHGQVAALAAGTTSEIPAELVAKRRLPVVEDGAGHVRPLSRLYPVRVVLREDVSVPFGSSGSARIRVPPRTLAERMLDSLLRVFRFV